MYKEENETSKYGNFPDPFASHGQKSSKAYGINLPKPLKNNGVILATKEVFSVEG